MTLDAVTRLIGRRDGQTSSNGLVDHVATTVDEEVTQLRAALVSNRRISIAMGILMQDQEVDEEQAFTFLRRKSQDSNRKLRDVAEDVIRDRRLLPGMKRAEKSAS